MSLRKGDPGKGVCSARNELFFQAAGVAAKVFYRETPAARRRCKAAAVSARNRARVTYHKTHAGVCMIIIANTLSAIALVLGSLLNIYFWIVIIAAVLTWVRPDPYNSSVRTLRLLTESVTEPVFYRVRKWLPFTYTSGLDFSPLVVLLAIELVNRIVIASLAQYAIALH